MSETYRFVEPSLVLSLKQTDLKKESGVNT